MKGEVVFLGSSLGPLVHLSREEERAAHDRGDTQLLVQSQIRLAIKLSNRAASDRLDLSTAFSIAIESLCLAIKGFDPDKASLYTYSRTVMWNALKKHFIRIGRISFSDGWDVDPSYESKLDYDYAEDLQCVRNAIAKLDEELRITAEGMVQGLFNTEIAKRLNVSASTATRLRGVVITEIRKTLKKEGRL